MQKAQTIDGGLFVDMLLGGTANLQQHVKIINDLNVFPIPDGDTGDNMLMTMLGGIQTEKAKTMTLCKAAQDIANNMMLSAKGNSGVILSQFFGGIADGFADLETADCEALGEALSQGVKKAYNAVVDPQEGTILTVAREATDYARAQKCETLSEFFANFSKQAARTLRKTTQMLAVLKKAGVVDSGGAGLLYIFEGMRQVLDNKMPDTQSLRMYMPAVTELDIDKFTEDSVLEYGYCTELLLRLQRCKVDVDSFQIETLSDRLKTIGESVVAFKTGTVAKVHVHTMTPDKALAICQEYGEFLKVKIDNMSLQHNNTLTDAGEEREESLEPEIPKEPKQFGIVAVASGEGIRQSFLDRGVDAVIDGGSTMNPSVEDFLTAFGEVNARNTFVLPNNANAVLAARQAASMYDDGKVFVLESHAIGDCYAAVTMFDPSCGDAQEIFEQMQEAMEGVVTAAVARSQREIETGGITVHNGDYFGFVGKEILCADENRETATENLVEKLNLSRYDICILIYGCKADESDAKALEAYIHKSHPTTEVFLIDGRQDLHDFILVLE